MGCGAMPKNRKPTVAVIGAGPSGLASAKALLEHGLEPVVYDNADDIGGMWGGPSRGAWSSYARTNLSYFSCGFSDYRWPEGTDVFPKRYSMIEYLRGYAAEFGLTQYIQFKTQVQSVEPLGGHKWKVTTQSGGKVEERIFDNVIVATGVFSQPYIPFFEGLLERYQGEVYHSADCYLDELNRENFANKKVLVVGAAFSGTEIAAKLLEYNSDVTVGFRKPAWFLPRWIQPWEDGPKYPTDLVFYNRSSDNPLMKNPRGYLKQLGGDPSEISPELAFDDISTAPLNVITTDDFIPLVRDGKIKVKRSKAFGFDEAGVLYSDGTREDFDAVIFCTGYVSCLPFLTEEVRETLEFDPLDQLQPVILHRQVFHPHLPGLAFVGYYRGPYLPIMELQSRWAARVFAGEIPGPALADMENGLNIEREIRNRRPRPQFPHGDFVGLADSLAKDVGVYPTGDAVADMAKYISEGPVVAAQFRLVGPNAKPELARQMIKATPAPLLDV